MSCESYMIYLSEQLSWRPLQEDSMRISCADNPTSQRIEIRRINLERALFPAPLCAPLAYNPSFKGLCVLSFCYEVYKVLALLYVIVRQANSPCILQLWSAFMSHSGRFSFLQTMLLLKFWLCVPNWSHFEGSTLWGVRCTEQKEYAEGVLKRVRCKEYFHRFYLVWSISLFFCCLSWSSHQKYTKVVFSHSRWSLSIHYSIFSLM